MDIEQQLRAALAPRDPRPELRAGILVRVSGSGATRAAGRAWNRTILFGTILAVAAAAAIMVANMMDTPGQQMDVAVPDPTPAVNVAVVMESESPIVQPDPVAEIAGKPEAPTETVPNAALFTVRVLPLDSGSADPAARAVLETIYAAFLTKLRAVPGLSLEVESTEKSADEALPDFELTVHGGRSGEGMFSIAVAGEDKHRLESKRQVSKDGGKPSVGSSFISQMVSDLKQGGAETLAEGMVESLRKRTFPVDPARKSQLLGQLIEPALEPAQRLKALTDLGELRSMSGVNEALRDPAVVRGVIALAGATNDPAIRAQAWRTMRGSRNQELVEPVIASLRHDVDGEVRLQAVALLQQDFATDQHVREALELVMLEESRPLVRALAQRAVKGEVAWKEYVVASLKDTGRADGERMEAFIYHLYPPGRTPGSYSSGQGRIAELLDDEGVQSLTYLLPKMAKSRESRQLLSALVTELIALQKPSVTAMLMGFLEKDADAGIKYVAITGMARRSNDPQMRAALEKIVVDDPDAELREQAAMALALPANSVSLYPR